MNLQDYRNKKKLRLVDAAPQIGISAGALQNVEDGRRFPAPQTIQRIEVWSGGAVKVTDLWQNWCALNGVDASQKKARRT